MNSSNINVNNIDLIDIVVGCDHIYNVFRFPKKLIYVMDNEEMIERETHVGYIHCRKDNGTILKITIIMKLGKSFNKLLHSYSITNQHTPIHNMFVTGELVFFSYSCWKGHSSPKWYIKYTLHSKEWVNANIYMMNNEQLNHLNQCQDLAKLVHLG